MVARGKMPPSHHDFALREMAFARSEAVTLARHQPGFDTSAALFFPGWRPPLPQSLLRIRTSANPSVSRPPAST